MTVYKLTHFIACVLACVLACVHACVLACVHVYKPTCTKTAPLHGIHLAKMSVYRYTGTFKM